MSESVDLLKKIVDLNPNGEHRPQQEKAVEEIEEAIVGEYNLLLQSPTGSGKALDVTTPILTVDSWKTMDELQPGDLVYTDTGETTEVVEVHEAFLSAVTYEVTFSDGSVIIADSDHLWTVAQNSKAVAKHDALADAITNGGPSRVEKVKAEILTSSLFNSTSVTVEELLTLPSVTVSDLEFINELASINTSYNGESLFSTAEVLEKLYLSIQSQEYMVLSTHDIARDIRDGIEYWVSTPEGIDFIEGEAAQFSFSSLILKPESEPLRNFNEVQLCSSLDDRWILIQDAYESGLTQNDELNEDFEHNALLFEDKKDAESYLQLIHTVGRLGSIERCRSGWKVTLFNAEESVSRKITEVNRIGSVYVRCITVDSPSHLFLAGKNLIPTHNTLSYLIPVIQLGQRTVVSTATKQLSEQATNTDLVLLDKALKKVAPDKRIKSALLKGRENYYCLKKANDGARLEDAANTMFSAHDMKGVSETGVKMATEIKELTDWADETTTGDRSEAPAVSNGTWASYSSTSAECPGKSVCPFGKECFAEYAREKAKTADVVITNHAVVAHDLTGENSVLLGERDVFVFDELHELDNYLSSAWGGRITGKVIRDSLKLFKQLPDLDEADVKEVERIGKVFDVRVANLPVGLMRDPPKQYTEFIGKLYASVTRIGAKANKLLNDKGMSEAKKMSVTVIKKKADEMTAALALLLDNSMETVRWVEVRDEIPSLNAAPLRIGPRLQEALNERGAIMIGTSATITVGGSFEIPVHNLGLDKAIPAYKTKALETPFNYSAQAMMFIPLADEFPSPVGAERQEHQAGVLEMTNDLVKAAGGRALSLSTTMQSAKNIAAHLRKKNPKMNILLQGDAPPPQLIQQFKDDETSVLCATMGMWHGLDLPGPTCSLVIIDKVPFKPIDDPLSVARQEYATSIGRNGFMDVYVADANIMLAQGVGRLIRTKTDKGVAVILDPRLRTKAYGSKMLESLPPMKIFSTKKTIVEALKRLAASLS